MTEIIVNAAMLHDVAAKALKVVPSKSVMPILDCFLVNVADTCELIATDLETSMVCDFEVISSSEYVSFCVNAKLFAATLKNLKDEDVAILVDETSITIQSKKGQYAMPRYNADSYPSYTKDEMNSVLTINAGTLASVCDRITFALSNDDLRPVMTGVSFKANDGVLELCASDGHVLSLITLEEVGDYNGEFIVSRKAISMLKSFIPNGDVDVAVNKNNILFESATISIYSRLIDGTYPDYHVVIPKSHNVHVLFSKPYMEETIRIVSVFSNKETKRVKMDVTSAMIKCVAQDIDFSVSAVQDLECQSTGDMNIAFNGSRFTDAISALGGEVDTVSMSLLSPSTAIVLKPADESVFNHIVLVMPMQYE